VRLVPPRNSHAGQGTRSHMPTQWFLATGMVECDHTQARSMCKVLVIAFTLTFAFSSMGKAEASCAKQSDNAVFCVALAEGEVSIIDTARVADVLCCCKTHSGGECCTRVNQCGGQPTGCFCAEPSVPGAQYLPSVARSYVAVMGSFCSKPLSSTCPPQPFSFDHSLASLDNTRRPIAVSRAIAKGIRTD